MCLGGIPASRRRNFLQKINLLAPCNSTYQRSRAPVWASLPTYCAPLCTNLTVFRARAFHETGPLPTRPQANTPMGGPFTAACCTQSGLGHLSLSLPAVTIGGADVVGYRRLRHSYDGRKATPGRFGTALALHHRLQSGVSRRLAISGRGHGCSW